MRTVAVKSEAQQAMLSVHRMRAPLIDETKEELKNGPGQQPLLTDPDARSMLQQGKSTGLVGYNVQTVVDRKHHPIIAREVTYWP